MTNNISSTDGSLQQLASMVRGTSRVTSPSVAASVDRLDVLPASTSKIARGLASEAAPPVREDDDVSALLEHLYGCMQDEPELAFAAQGGLSSGTIMALR